MALRVPYRGIIEIVGEHDAGKTIAALQTVTNTKDIVFVDDDVKGSGTARQMKEQGMDFDLYIDLSQERAKLGQTPTADELLDYVVLPTIKKITEKRRKVIVWDTWRIVYQSARMHVERNKSKYDNVVKWQGNNTIIQGLVSKVARMIEVKLLNELKDHCDLLIVTHHIKDKYKDNVIVGEVPESSNTFNEVCNMRIWLRRNMISKVPVMLFLKRPNAPKMIGGQIRFINIVPLKITPTAKHNSIWDAIEEYEKVPIESRAPREDETPTPEELAIISGTLTPEMQEHVKNVIAFNLKMEDQFDEVESTKEISNKIMAIDPSIPQTPVQLLTFAREQLQLDMSQIQDILQMNYQEINAAAARLPEFWKQLQDHKAQMIEASKPARKIIKKK